MQTSLKNNQKLEHILETHLAMSNEFFSDMLLTLSPKLVLRILRNSDSKNGDLAEIARSLECNVKLSELSADEIRWLAVMAK
jgi:exoribonuclease R